MPKKIADDFFNADFFTADICTAVFHAAVIFTSHLFTAVIWLITLLFTNPESEETLDNFVREVRPPGPGWKFVRDRINLEPIDSLFVLVLRFVFGSGVLYGLLASIGAFLLHQERGGWIGLLVAVSCGFMIKKTRLITHSFEKV